VPVEVPTQSPRGLHKVLGSKSIRFFSAPGRPPLPGSTVTAVQVLSKHGYKLGRVAEYP